MDVKKYIAVGPEAERRRIMLGTVSRDKPVLKEVFRFVNGPIQIEGSLCWNFTKLFEIKACIKKGS